MLSHIYESVGRSHPLLFESTTFFIRKGYRNMGYSNILRAAIVELKSKEIKGGNTLVVASTHSIQGILSAKIAYEKEGCDIRFCNYADLPSIASLLLHERLIKRNMSLEQLYSEYISKRYCSFNIDSLNLIKFNSKDLNTMMIPHLMYASSYKLAEVIEKVILLKDEEQRKIHDMLIGTK